jgi:ferredoxin
LCSNTNCSSPAESRCIAHGSGVIPDSGTVEPATYHGTQTPGGPVVDELHVRVDQDLCTGDGLCVQYAPEVFEFDVDGLAYVKGTDGELRLAPGSSVEVPAHLRLDVIDSARECPGECIHVTRASDGVAIAGPGADPTADAEIRSRSAA